MHLEGTVAINAGREKVWQFLTDPNAVSQCAPGVESLTIVEPDKKFQVVAAIGFGSVKVTFKTDVEWLEMEMPQRAKMKAHGVAPGSAADVISEMLLNLQGDGSTELKWTADVVVLGTIASLAARLMGTVTQKIVGSFFNCVKTKIEV
jgi:carbon monoxide dehydrogenase subunit G